MIALVFGFDADGCSSSHCRVEQNRVGVHVKLSLLWKRGLVSKQAFLVNYAQTISPAEEFFSHVPAWIRWALLCEKCYLVSWPFYFGAFIVSVISSPLLSRDKTCP